jgi:hypothetical protein
MAKCDRLFRVQRPGAGCLYRVGQPTAQGSRHVQLITTVRASCSRLNLLSQTARISTPISNISRLNSNISRRERDAHTTTPISNISRRERDAHTTTPISNSSRRERDAHTITYQNQ